MPIKLTDEQVRKLADGLQGTCKTFSEGLVYIDLSEELNEEDFEAESLQELEEHIFRCAQCGWWCEVAERSSFDDGSGEDYCDECKPGDDDYDDCDDDEELDEDDD